MRVEGFPYEVKIFGQDRRPIDDADGYVRLAHGEHYLIQLKNHDGKRAKATVTADGVEVGIWVIPAHYNGATLIERPTSASKRLTFFSAGSDEAKAALLGNVPAEKLGVVQVSFAREAPKPEFTGVQVLGGGFRGGVTRGSGQSFAATRGLGAGGTGLSGASNQVFGTTSFTDDPAFKPVVVSVRLVHYPDRKIGLDVQPLEGHRPRENTVPPPVGGFPGGKAVSAPQVA